MGYFWIPDSFVRVHARNLLSSSQSIYMVICCHANKEKETFISYQRMAEMLNFSKNTVKAAVDELIAYQLLVRLNKKTGKASHLKVLPVPNKIIQPYQPLGAKEYNKELFKENVSKNFKKRNNQPEAIADIVANRKYGLNELRNDIKNGKIFQKNTKND